MADKRRRVVASGLSAVAQEAKARGRHLVVMRNHHGEYAIGVVDLMPVNDPRAVLGFGEEEARQLVVDLMGLLGTPADSVP